ncbi:hypothetical protein [Escherichia coli]|uniref:hypothetical protein n=1 Tax=Escherichia coli TaxID=562 RepID=UPI0007A054A8|nr:hypothetical protein [Escherichia coli]EGO4139469.1 hypothetical protein [Escherichia coli]EHL6437310.1 hypothetical protein [Escherichia coli]EJQ0084153.1 hypothetical protein [Escherichia coli]KYV76763.1 hypothetical protein AMK85_23615 [Escherichia coli]NYW56318.1 hypothetical protein [Escherichia coli]
MTEHRSGHADDNFPFSWGSDSIFMHACLQSYGESICDTVHTFVADVAPESLTGLQTVYLYTAGLLCDIVFHIEGGPPEMNGIIIFPDDIIP